MKRSRLTRKTPLKAKGKSRFPKRRNPDYLAWIRTLPCVVDSYTPSAACGRLPGRYRIEAIHLKTKGSGGDDVGNVLPACPVHHDQQEGRTAEFSARYGLNLKSLALAYAVRYQEEQCSG